MISLRNVSCSFDGRAVLKDLTVEIRKERTAIIGVNGSGKSTLARLFNGLQLPDRGEIEVLGLDPRRKGSEVRRKVGFLFQDPDRQLVFPVVGEDLAFGLKNHNVPFEEYESRIQEVVERLSLQRLLSRQTHTLSGGEKQLVALGGVMVLRPEIVVMDEPFTFLDHPHRFRLRRLLDEMNEPLIVVTHDLEAVAEFDRVLFLHDGEVRRDGPPEPVIRSYLEMVSR